MTISELIDILKEQGLYKNWNSNRKYWEKRFEILEDAMNNKGIEYFHDLERIYGNAIKQTENDIARWYLRYAKNEKISLAEAKKQLTKNELKEFRMSVEEYVKKGESMDPQWAAELERASTKFHVTRIEALKMQMQQNVEYMIAEQADGVDKLMRDIFTDSYYHSAFEIQKGIGVGWDLMKLDKNVIDKAMSKPWTADGTNFSERIWGKYRPELVKKLHDGLTLNLIQGKSANELVNEITNQFNVKKHQAQNLVQTEKAYFQSLAQKDAFKTLGVEEYEIVATLDTKTSDICREMDGKHFKLDDFTPGATAPPFHNRCRTATAPYFDDEFTIDEERAARETDGSYYTVPGNMKYKDWYDKYVKEEKDVGKEILAYIPTYMIKGQFNVDEMKKQFIQSINNDEGSAYHKQMLQYYAETTDFIEDTDAKYPFAYLPSKDAIVYNPNHELFYDYDLNIIASHELSHRADVLNYESWLDDDFIKAIENTSKKVYDNYDKYEKMFNAIDGKYKADDSLSDIFSALTNDEMNLPAGHDPSYWEKGMKNKALEIFANLSSIDQLGLSSKEEFDGILKELYEAYRKIVGD